MRFNTLHDWLSWQETLHPKNIELGLDRVDSVLQRLDLSRPGFFTITVAGTNGKGSCVAMLESILLQAGYKVGAYTSPHLLRYNERIRVQGREAEDQQLCDAFARIDEARENISLTYFEFGTLAAIDIFSRAGLDVVIMEVGLGGRLDAVNVLDADIAVLCALDIDHTDWLGKDRDTIAMEKAGILRKGKPVVIADPDVPGSVLDHAETLNSPLYRLGYEYGFDKQSQSWSWWSKQTKRSALIYPALRGEGQLRNASCVLMVLALLAETFPVNQQDVRNGLANVSLPGRFQIIPGAVLQVLDVAHNPQSARALSQTLNHQACKGKTHAVIGMLQDKDIRGVIEQMTAVVDQWYVADLNVARGEKAATIVKILRDIYTCRGQTLKVEQTQSVTEAHRAALAMADEGDRIVIFGSFITVAEVLQHVL